MCSELMLPVCTDGVVALLPEQLLFCPELMPKSRSCCLRLPGDVAARLNGVAPHLPAGRSLCSLPEVVAHLPGHVARMPGDDAVFLELLPAARR